MRKEELFRYYWKVALDRVVLGNSDKHKDMFIVRALEIKLSSLNVALRRLGILSECKRWGEDNGRYEEIRKVVKEAEERFLETGEQRKILEVIDFQRVSRELYLSAMEKGISHEDFMTRLKGEFSELG
jgi:hypothetical protein